MGFLESNKKSMLNNRYSGCIFFCLRIFLLLCSLVLGRLFRYFLSLLYTLLRLLLPVSVWIAGWYLYRVGKRKSEMKKKEVDATGTVKAISVAAGLGLAAWALSKHLGSVSDTSDDKKMMKAPGRDYKIPRADFERDPASYFRGLRK